MADTTPTQPEKPNSGRALTPDELAWARDNLEEMRRNAGDNTVLLLTLAGAFVLGLLAYLLGELILLDGWRLPEGWGRDLLGDFLYNLGIALWTSVVVVFLLEVIVEAQQRRWHEYVDQVEETLRASGESVPEPEEDDDQMAAILARLDAIAARLDAMEHRS